MRQIRSAFHSHPGETFRLSVSNWDLFILSFFSLVALQCVASVLFARDVVRLFSFFIAMHEYEFSPKVLFPVSFLAFPHSSSHLVAFFAFLFDCSTKFTRYWKYCARLFCDCGYPVTRTSFSPCQIGILRVSCTLLEVSPLINCPLSFFR